MLGRIGAGACAHKVWLQFRIHLSEAFRDNPRYRTPAVVPELLSLLKTLNPLEDLPALLFAEPQRSARQEIQTADALVAALRSPPALWADAPLCPGAMECPFEVISEARLRKEWEAQMTRLATGIHLRICRQDGGRYLLTSARVLEGLHGRLPWWLPLRPMDEMRARDPWNIDISTEHAVDVIRTEPGKAPYSIALALTPGRFAELRQWQCERWVPGELL
jgi:hypothetical protein